MFYFIKQIAIKFRVIQIIILSILLPVNLFFLRKDFKPSKINMIYKSKFNKKVKFILSSISFKGKKITTYRTFERSFFSKPDKTSVILNSNGRNNEFKNGSDPKLFKYKNKILLYFQRKHQLRRDTKIFLHDPNTNKTYNINSPFKYNGKNWVPISGLNSLIFVYSIDPLVILKVVDLNKGKMKAITKVKKGFKPEWDVQDIDSSFTGSKRGGSPMVKVGDNRYLGIGHSTKYLLKTFKTLGSSQRAYIYFFDFKKKIYYINYLTNNKIGHLYCIGAELTNKNNIIKFYFNYSSPLIEYLVSKIYIFDIELDKRENKKSILKSISAIIKILIFLIHF